MLRHVTDASQLVPKPQRWKATLSSVAKPLGTRQASAPLLPTLIAFGREVWKNKCSIFYLYSFLGVVEYQFYRTFPADKRAIVMQAMEYITNNSCIRFQPKIDSTVDYVNINYGADCHSDVGRVGGMQTLNLNR